MDRIKQAVYNAVSNMKRSVVTFSKNICKGLSKPKITFVTEMLFGMMTAQSVKLTDIGRALKEDISLKHTEERLRRNLSDFDKKDIECASENYMRTVLKKCRPDTLLLVDGGDMTKPYGKKFEGLCDVRDGSTGKVEKGFPTVGIIALTDDKLPLPVYENIYSYDKDFVSENAETFKALDFVGKYFGRDNIRVFDRGYDSKIVTSKLVESGVKFIVRMNDNRNIIHNGKTQNILEVAKQFKGKYKLTYQNQKGKTVDCKVWITPVILDGITLNLVICNGLGDKPLMLLTNIFDDDKSICVTLSKCYLMRWKIEEFYRFKKQTFKFEDIRVMSLKSMNNLNFLLNLLIGFLSVKATEDKDSPVIVTLINQVKHIFNSKNILYPLCIGIFATFAMVGAGLGCLFPVTNASGLIQLSLC